MSFLRARRLLKVLGMEQENLKENLKICSRLTVEIYPKGTKRFFLFSFRLPSFLSIFFCVEKIQNNLFWRPAISTTRITAIPPQKNNLNKKNEKKNELIMVNFQFSVSLFS